MPLCWSVARLFRIATDPDKFIVNVTPARCLCAVSQLAVVSRSMDCAAKGIVLTTSVIRAYCLLGTLILASAVNGSAAVPQSSRNPTIGPNRLTSAETLGRALFFDKGLSVDGSMSCASCHDPARHYADASPTAHGREGHSLTRNTPTLLGIANYRSFFWDGRSATLEVQALQPLFNPVELGLTSESDLVGRLQRNPRYPTAFAHIFPNDSPSMSLKTVARAIAAYERTLTARHSPFDRYVYDGEKSAMSAAAIRGLAIFQGRAACASCHLIGEHPTSLSDQQFHASPLRLPDSANSHLVELTRKLSGARQNAPDLTRLISQDSDIAALGRFAVTLNPPDIGQFKTPSLRNVAVTAPYMHDGSVATLREAVQLELYAREGSEHRPIVLSQGELDDLIEFLGSLTSP
jgi:cytochrome c peroxidase